MIDAAQVCRLAAGILWVFWAVTWMLASRWSAQTVKTTRPGERTIELLLTMFGAGFLAAGGFPDRDEDLPARVYSLGLMPAWLLVAGVAGGFGLCWWARLHLGRMWSMDITLKQDHRVIDTGPYGWVRHPIYTGLLLAGWATAAVNASPLSFLGAVLWTLGIYLKARREEQLLSAELGPAYEDYRRRVPMLLPRIRGAHAPHRA